MKKTYMLIVLALLGASCAKQTADLAGTDAPARPSEPLQADTDLKDDTINIPLAEATIENESATNEVVSSESNESDLTLDSDSGEAVSEDSESDDEIAMETVTIPENDDTSILDQRNVTPEITETLFPEDVFEPYMIKPGDYLVKIARNEYGDPRKWRDIYNWNKEKIGDNPNLIYPFHFLSLLKSADEAKTCQLSYSDRQINKGETLWSIAREVYGNELAWIVLYWDNEEMIDSNEGILVPGTRIRVRDNIDPCMASK